MEDSKSPLHAYANKLGIKNLQFDTVAVKQGYVSSVKLEGEVYGSYGKQVSL